MAAEPGLSIVEASGAKETRRTSQIAPGSRLSLGQAVAAAAEVRRLVPGSAMHAVRPTGSMRPLFDGNCLLLTEPAPFTDLAVGDIIIFRRAGTGARVVHRILEQRKNGYWTKGDYNSSMDDELVTAQNYESRVFGIIYTERSDENVASTTRLDSSLTAAAR